MAARTAITNVENIKTGEYTCYLTGKTTQIAITRITGSKASNFRVGIIDETTGFASNRGQRSKHEADAVENFEWMLRWNNDNLKAQGGKPRD